MGTRKVRQVDSDEIPWADVHKLKARLDRLEAARTAGYEQRAELMKLMYDAGMAQRAIAGYWGVAQPVVSWAINGGKAAVRRQNQTKV